MLLVSGLFTDRNLLALTVGRMANLALRHGNAVASCYGHVWLGMLSGAVFGDYQAGYRFGKLALDLVDQRGPFHLKPRVYLCFGYCVLPWTKHLRAGLGLVQRAFDTAYETGDVNFAAYSYSGVLLIRFEIGELSNLRGEGLLILQKDGEQQIEAEARSDLDKVALHFHRSALTSFELPVSLLRYVIRTKECVSLSDASAENLFSEDEYFRRKSPRSVLCLPLIKQQQLTGVLYLENNLAPGVLTPARLATLELIASQAAISLEQATLYAELKKANEELQTEISERKCAQAALEKSSSELRKSEQRLQDIVDNTTAVVFVKDLDFRYLLVNREYERRYHIRRDEIIGKTDFDLFIDRQCGMFDLAIGNLLMLSMKLS
jgi:GAF domain-containing protein